MNHAAMQARLLRKKFLAFRKKRNKTRRMGCSSLSGQLAFGVILILTIGLTAAALFSDSWREIRYNNGNHDSLPDHQGLFNYNCKSPHDNDNDRDQVYCEYWWKNLPKFEKATICTMCLALMFELIALVWAFVACFSCCCKKFLNYFLVLFAVLSTICLAIAIIVYAANNNDAFKDLTGDFKSNLSDGGPKSSLGYSYWLAVGALACSVGSVIVASLAIGCAQKRI